MRSRGGFRIPNTFPSSLSAVTIRERFESNWMQVFAPSGMGRSERHLHAPQQPAMRQAVPSRGERRHAILLGLLLGTTPRSGRRCANRAIGIERRS